MKVFADTPVPPASGDDVEIFITPPESFKITSLGRLISSAIQFILIGAGLIAFVYLLLGGIQWITSGGDKAGVDAARQKIMAAVIGLVIVFATWALITVLEKFLGVSIITGTLTIPSPADL